MSFEIKVKYQDVKTQPMGSLIFTLHDEVRKSFDTMVAMGREFYVYGNNGSNTMDLIVRETESEANVHVQDAERSISKLTEGADQILRQQLWWPELRQADVKSLRPNLVVDIPEQFKANFDFIHPDGRHTSEQTSYLPGSLYMAYRDMLDVKCHLEWEVTKATMGKECPMRVVSDDDDEVLDVEIVRDNWPELTVAAEILLKRERWVTK